MLNTLMKTMQDKASTLVEGFSHSIEEKLSEIFTRVIMAGSSMIVFCFALNSLIFQIGTQFEEVGYFSWQKVNTFYFIVCLLALGCFRVATKGIKEDKRLHPSALNPELPIRRLSQQRRVYDRPRKKRRTTKRAARQGSRRNTT